MDIACIAFHSSKAKATERRSDLRMRMDSTGGARNAPCVYIVGIRCLIQQVTSPTENRVREVANLKGKMSFNHKIAKISEVLDLFAGCRI